MKPRLLCIGGEDHNLRIPFLLEMRDRGFDVVAAGSGDPEPFVRAHIEYHPIPLVRFINPLADLHCFKEIRRVVDKLAPQIVQCFDTKLNLMVPPACQKDRGAPVVSTVNGLGWLYSSRSPIALALRPVFRTLQRRADACTAVTVFQNSDDQTFYRDGGLVNHSRDLLIAGSGIDVERFETAMSSGPSPSQMRKTLGLENKRVITTVTRLTRQKGIPTLLDAARRVHAKNPDAVFLLVGPRENEGTLAVSQQELEMHAPYVRTLGMRSDVPSLLAMSDVFVYPTELREGIPRALFEAGLAGLPIVATRMPGCTDVVRDCVTGYLVPPHEPRVLADCLLECLSNPNQAREMGERARSLVRKEFNLLATVSRYAAVYSELLKLPLQRRLAIAPEATAAESAA